MFDNVVRLIGFVGSDAELKTTKTQREFRVLSLAATATFTYPSDVSEYEGSSFTGRDGRA